MTEEDFYKSQMLAYSKKIAYLIMQDYGEILDEETKSKIQKFNLTDDSIVFLDTKDFPEVSVDGKKGTAYARKSEGKVYFPTYDRSCDIITFTRKREQDLVHEMFHIVTKSYVEKQELVQNGIKVGEYKPGMLFDEALVEKSASDFATRHNLIYQPMASYIPYVHSLETFMKKYGIKHNHQMFNRNYQNIINNATQQEQYQYYIFEYNHTLRRLGKANINSESHAPVQDPSELGQQEQLNKPKVRKKTLNNNATPNNNGFANIITLLIMGVVIAGIILVCLLT